MKEIRGLCFPTKQAELENALLVCPRNFFWGQFNKTFTGAIYNFCLYLLKMLKTIATVVNYTCKSSIKLTSGGPLLKIVFGTTLFCGGGHVAKMFSEAIFFSLHIKKC